MMPRSFDLVEEGKHVVLERDANLLGIVREKSIAADAIFA
jgi:hypothetical protein